MEIKLEDVSYRYHGEKKNCLNHINMKINHGEIVAILGKSGSGKTTLIELLASLRTPSEGVITVGNYIISNDITPNKNEFNFDVGVVSQFPEEQFLKKTVRKELEMEMKFFNYRLDQVEKRMKDALLMVGLEEKYLDISSSKLSYGEKRKLALASILVFNPKVLILDDPMIGLNQSDKNKMIHLLTMLKKRYHKTIIIATHDTEFIHKLVDYIYVLDDGKIVLEGDKYSVFQNEKLLQKCHIQLPKTIAFSQAVYHRRNIKIGYRDDINDLIKDIYRYAK